MPEFSTFTEFFTTTDPVLIGIGVLGLLLIILIFRRPKDRTGPLQEALAARDAELREAQNAGSRADALAAERKTEIDRLNGDLSKLRAKLEEDASAARDAAARISSLETELRGEREEAEETVDRHKAILMERDVQADALREQVRGLTESGTAKSDEISTLKSRILVARLGVIRRPIRADGVQGPLIGNEGPVVRVVTLDHLSALFPRKTGGIGAKPDDVSDRGRHVPVKNEAPLHGYLAKRLPNTRIRIKGVRVNEHLNGRPLILGQPARSVLVPEKDPVRDVPGLLKPETVPMIMLLAPLIVYEEAVTGTGECPKRFSGRPFRGLVGDHDLSDLTPLGVGPDPKTAIKVQYSPFKKEAHDLALITEGLLPRLKGDF